MSTDDEPPALAYIERTLAESYRKEIDQEENVWRSLPFFAATLALQLAALFQIIDKLPQPETPLGRLSLLLLAGAGSCTLTSLAFLAASIYPAKFNYVARETALLTYARQLIREEEAEAAAPDDRLSALVTLKSEVARQYAEAADHNRQINKRRDRRRSVAGLAALGSVLMTVLLVATAYAHYVSERAHQDPIHAAQQSAIDRPPPGRPGHDTQGRPVEPSRAGAAAHAGRHQRLVGPA